LWIDRGWLRAQDRALLDGPCGLAGKRVLGSLVLAQASAIPHADALLESARALGATATLLHGRLLVARVLAESLEPAQQLLRALRGLWRQQAWGLPTVEPRIWAS
jgi:urease accessory protein